MSLFNFFEKSQSKIVNTLSQTIFGESVSLASTFIIYVNDYTPPEDDIDIIKDETWVSLYSEFIFFYLHNCDRLFYKKSPTNLKSRNNSMTLLLDLIIQSTSVTIYETLQEDEILFKQKLFKENYYSVMNEYSSSKEFLDKESPILGSGTASILARKIAIILNSPTNPEILLRTLEIIIKSYKEVDLAKIILD